MRTRLTAADILSIYILQSSSRAAAGKNPRTNLKMIKCESKHKIHAAGCLFGHDF